MATINGFEVVILPGALPGVIAEVESALSLVPVGSVLLLLK